MGEPTLIDTHWLGRPSVIASWLTDDDVLIDCGPATTLPNLLEGLGDRRPRALLLTHIHFDHAGAAGALVERWPELEVWVHRRGAKHLASPERLEASARRVFGEVFDEQFGSLTPIPEKNLRPLEGGETVFGFDVLYTPGHASHHVAYSEGDSGRVFVGDIAAVRLVEGGPVIPPMPPPDIDVDLWLESIQRVSALEPSWLGLPHFGAVTNPAEHLVLADHAVRRHADLASSLDLPAYGDALRRELDATPPDIREAYLATMTPEQNHAGVRRWASAAAQ